MTAQIGDKIIIDGNEKDLMGDLPIDMSDVEQVSDHTSFSTACWRGYVATWEVRGGKIYLNHLSGNLRLPAERPVLASWITCLIQVIDGDLINYVHMGYESGYEAVLELDIVEGIVRRQRRLTVPNPKNSPGISYSTPAWEYLPEAKELFPPECAVADKWHGVPDPSEGEPQFENFSGTHLRKRVMAERNAKGWKHGETMVKAGYASAKGGLLAEWERGQKQIASDMEENLCEALGISGDDRAACRESDHADYQSAWDAWADEPVVPTLKVRGDARSLCYAAPLEYRDDPEALETWAEACVKISWRSPDSIVTRRKRMRFNSLGERISGPGEEN